ncbi:pyridoxal 5'-phosphate synthase glutaminase subunit PdxT [Sulfodiicoccus acidiphilus]|uniref:Pyridoxal 5'-phosphate synthase subunit PdxT n=1 Tax=Sulfodiicoccus acidiphilus TaxID=1670455 RepID=A0A348B753_9CREN|nr:pyridoxal 5'-phosphate synthase glutaminase subunit PdxT [Sulfodiicoccus acidiphilus]BBD74005.1 pyridoxal 5'-phosphate synthase glutaminase subunit PdxT [Sulfodiicoccus acidiphilus]GGT87220.1 pyridoxal 5'-phosphate synthase glutaminase subunit PdxT [Sulfodiicoccus acidiphilus]
MRIGILAYQGSFEEHAHHLRKALSTSGLEGEVIPVKKRMDLTSVEGIVLPGGESTTLGVVAERMGILEDLRTAIHDGLPVLGTCAGAIMLAKETSDSKVKIKQPTLGVMDFAVVRNYYGRQRESFQETLDMSRIGAEKVLVPFIRAPAIVKVWGNTEILAELEGRPVMVQEGPTLATTFHPELSSSYAVHQYFLKIVKR